MNEIFKKRLRPLPKPADEKRSRFLRFAVSGIETSADRPEYGKDTGKVLIADPSALTRSTLASLLISMGVKPADLVLVSNLADAVEEVERLSPRILFCEYDFGRQIGIPVFHVQKARFASNRDFLSVMITGDRSQMAVARAAKEDIDLFVVKPFVPEQLRLVLHQAIERKHRFPAWSQAIQKTQAHIAQGKLAEAIQALQHARSIRPVQAELNFYVETAVLAKHALANAVSAGKYGKRAALRGAQAPSDVVYRKDEYKCLVDLYELLLSQKNYAGAYKVIKRMLPYFPEDTDRLTQLFRLAVVTGNVEEIDHFYELFLSTQERPEHMVQAVCSSLLHTAKYWYRRGEPARGLDLLRKACLASAGRTGILSEIILWCGTMGHVKEAQEFMKRIPADARRETSYFALEFFIFDKMHANGQSIHVGWKLLDRGVCDPLIFEIMIRRLMERGKHDPAEHLAWDAIHKWPAMRERFLALISKEAPVVSVVA